MRTRISMVNIDFYDKITCQLYHQYIIYEQILWFICYTLSLKFSIWFSSRISTLSSHSSLKTNLPYLYSMNYIHEIYLLIVKSFKLKNQIFLFQKLSLFLYKSLFSTITLNICQSIHFTDHLYNVKSFKLKYLIFCNKTFLVCLLYFLINFNFLSQLIYNLLHWFQQSLLISAQSILQSSTVQL